VESTTTLKYTLVYDTTPPVVSITNPSDGSTFKSLPVVSGSVNAQIVGLSDVEVKVSSWSGGAWNVMPGYNFVSVGAAGVYTSSFRLERFGWFSGWDDISVGSQSEGQRGELE